ncbi:OmpA family protein [Leptospira wolbachii serovar Codice str. CDC]|uniref:OmpA family protein n=2 Tax=Leptospira TaxID=171 RepID=R9AEI9_9LEPT|nr:OmpA family protein [Leptospira wolbachii serovar Codice str. CDC]
MLVGTGVLLLWFWRKSIKTKSTVPLVREEKALAAEKNTTVIESPVKEFSILFGPGSSLLESQSMIRIRECLSPFILSQIGYITLIGSADASGNLATNRRLVKERIQAVESYLISLGIPKGKIEKVLLNPSFGRSFEQRRLLRSVQIQYKLETLK